MDELDFDSIEVEPDPVLKPLMHTPVDSVDIDLRIVLGHTTMKIHELLRLARGAVIALDATEEDDISIYANDQEIAYGQLRLNGEQVQIVVTRVPNRGPGYRLPSDPFKKAG